MEKLDGEVGMALDNVKSGAGERAAVQEGEGAENRSVIQKLCTQHNDAALSFL